MMKLFVHRVLLDYTQDPLPPCVRMWNFSTCRFEQHLKYLSSLIRNILQAWKLFVLLIIYPNWVQKGMFFSPTSLSLSLSVFFLACMYVYVCACACLGCIVVDGYYCCVVDIQLFFPAGLWYVMHVSRTHFTALSPRLCVTRTICFRFYLLISRPGMGIR